MLSGMSAVNAKPCHVERNEHSECSRNICPNVDKTLSRSFDCAQDDKRIGSGWPSDRLRMTRRQDRMIRSLRSG